MDSFGEKKAEKYKRALKDITCLGLPLEKNGCVSNYQSYAVYLKKEAPVSRDKLMQLLLDKGISTRRGIMTVHREIAYGDYCKGLRLPVSEDASDRSLLLPLYVPMDDRDIDIVVTKLRKFLT